MAKIALTGPYNLDLGLQGLGPGRTQATWWHGWTPEPRNFTVTVTAHPGTQVAGTENNAANALSVSETSVQYVPTSVTGGIIATELIINATLHNTGPAAIRFVTLYISFVTA